MNYERFIAGRISGSSKDNFSSLIMKIAIAAVALSMVVMIITTSVITGFKNEISSKVFSFWGHIHVTDGNVGNSFELIPITKDLQLIDTIESITKIDYERPRTLIDKSEMKGPQKSKGGVSRVETYTIVPAIISANDQFEGILLKGLEKDYNWSNLQPFLKKGKLVSYQDSSASRDIVISEQTASRLGFEVGDGLVLNFVLEGEQIKRRFNVSGIYKTGLEEYDRRFALVDNRILQEVLQWSPDQVSGLEIYIDDLHDLQLLNEYIYFELLPGNLYSESIRNKFYQIFEWLELQNINEQVIIILMVLVAVINMITALLIFVLERTEMIGVLKSLGATDWSIRRIFLYNASIIIVKGLLIGNALAFFLCLLQRYTGILKLSEKEYYLSTVPIEFNIPAIILINIGTIVVTILFLILPSIVVSKISPVKAVRFN